MFRQIGAAIFALFVILPVIMILACILLPVLSFLKTADALILFYAGLASGGFRKCSAFLCAIYRFTGSAGS